MTPSTKTNLKALGQFVREYRAHNDRFAASLGSPKLNGEAYLREALAILVHTKALDHARR